MYKTNFFFVAVILCALYGVAQAQLNPHQGVSATRQQVVANYERRRDQLKTLVAETKEKVADHEHGRSLQEDEEYALLQKRIGLYEKKLEKMEGPMNEREIDRLMERTKMRAERRHIEL